MTEKLFIGDYTYSSWSLRGWLLFEQFGLSVPRRIVDFNKASVAEQLADYAPARTVPTWITPEGIAISESLAIAGRACLALPRSRAVAHRSSCARRSPHADI